MELYHNILGISSGANKINLGAIMVMDEITWNKTQKSRKYYLKNIKIMIVAFIITSLLAISILYLGDSFGLFIITSILFFYIGYTFILIQYTNIIPRMEFLQTLSYVEYAKNVIDERDLFRKNKKFTYPFYGSLIAFTVILCIILLYYLQSKEFFFMLPIAFGGYSVYSGSVIYINRNYYYKRNSITLGEEHKNLVIIESKAYIIIGITYLIIGITIYLKYFY